MQQPSTSQLLPQQRSQREVATCNIATRDKRRRRFSAQLKDLQQCYLALRSNHQQCQTQAQPQADAAADVPLGPGGTLLEAGKVPTAEVVNGNGGDTVPPPSCRPPLPRLIMQQSTTLSDAEVDASIAAVAKQTAGPVPEACEADASSAAEEEGDSHDLPPSPSAHVAKRSRVVPPEGPPLASSGTEPNGLAEFSRMLSVFTHFGSLQVILPVFLLTHPVFILSFGAPFLHCGSPHINCWHVHVDHPYRCCVIFLCVASAGGGTGATSQQPPIVCDSFQH